MFYRAAKCKPCGVKCGQGDCPKCAETREELRKLEAEMKEQFGSCQLWLMKNRKVYPRSCQTCKLGPCKFGLKQ